MKYTGDELEPLRRAIDNDRGAVCDSLGLIQDGARYFCPFCQNDGARHDTGDLSIEAGFACFRCGWTGDGIKLMMEYNRISFLESVKRLSGLLYIPLPESFQGGRGDRGEYQTGNQASYSTTTRIATANLKEKKPKKVHATTERAIEAILWGLTQRDGKTYTKTRLDPYEDKDGLTVAYMARFDCTDGKTYRPIHKVEGGWQSGDPVGLWPLFNLPALLSSSETAEPVYICEGEKACQTGSEIGLTCTGSAHGAKSPERTDWTPLHGKDIVILPDNDEAGFAYAETVASLACQVGANSIKVVNLPDLPEKGDIVEYLENGGTREQIEELATGTPEWEHGEPEDKPSESYLESPKGDQDCETERTTAIEQAESAQGNPVESARLGKPYPCTDLGNAERLVFWFGDRIRWDIARGAWRCWDGKRWKVDYEITLLELAGKMARKIRDEADAAPHKKQGQADIAGELWLHAKRSESREKLASCVVVAKSLSGVAIEPSQWDTHPMLLNVKNGTIDLKTGILKPHDREDYITRLAHVNYEPELTCSRWQKFLAESTGGDNELETYLQKIAGYCLTGDTREEALFFIYGVADSGKTTYLESLKSLLGEYACTVDTEMLCKAKFNDGGKASPEFARLDGARLAAGSEMEKGRELAEAKLKSITGGEKIIARYMRENPFEFLPQFKILIAMNDCPKASSEDTGLWRRMKRIEFNHAVPKEKRDESLKPYLQKEGAGAVLAWAVQGCLLWQKEGLKMPESVKASTAKYKEESDPLNNWIEDCLTIERGAWTLTSYIQHNYKEYCTEQGNKYPVNPKTIARKLETLGCKQERRNYGRGWAGVSLTDDSNDSNDSNDSQQNENSFKWGAE